MTFYNKIKWVLGILMVFVLIVATNLIDRSNFIQVRDSVVTIYEDRLIANDLIFEISKLVQEKEIAVALSDSIFYSQKNSKINNNIQEFVSRFEQTKVTVNERRVFDELKNNLEALKNSENTFIQSKFIQKEMLVKHIANVEENLHELSKIQLNEGQRQMLISKRVLDTVELFTQIEIYFLIVLAIIVQIIVIYKPKEE